MAKLSEIYKVGMSANDIPKVSYNENNGGGNSAPASYVPGKKLSEYYSVGMSAPDAKQTSIPKLTQTAPTVDYKLDKPEAKQNLFQKATSLLGLTAPTTGAVQKMLEKPAEDKRASQLAAFDKADTSSVIYSTPDFKLTQNKLNMWLDPSYEMSDAEKKQAKKATKELLNVVNYDKYFGDMDPQEFGKLYQSLSELGTKSSAREQFARGFGEAMPFIKSLENTAAKQLDKVNGNTNVSAQLKKEAQNIEDTGAYKAGRAVSKMSQYYMLNKSGLLDPLTSRLSGLLLPKLGAKFGQSVANVLSDEVADIALDTIPELAENIRNGMSADEVRNEVFKNLGINLAYNVGGEAIPQVIKAFKDNFGKKITKETAEQIIESADDIADALTKEAVELNNNAPSVDLTAQTVKQTNTPIDKLKAVQKPVASSVPEVKGKNLIMAEDTGLAKNTDELLEQTEKNLPSLDEPIIAKGYAESSGNTLEQGYRERGYAQHVRGDETPMKVEGLSKEVMDDFKEDQRFYEVLKNQDTKALADEVYQSGDKAIKIGDKVYQGSVESKFRELLSERNPASLPLGHQIAKDYQKAGNHQMAVNIIDDMSEALTKSGQFSQAAVINMVKNDPLTALQYAQKQIDKINKEGLKRFGDKWKNFKLTDDEVKAFGNIADGDEKAIRGLYDQIGSRLGKEYPTTFMEKLLEGRKVAMLFNVRTNVRNFGANIPTLGLRWMSDRVEALGQNIAHLINPDFKVTQSITGSGIDGRKLAKEVFESDRVKPLLEGDVGKYELPDIKNALMKDRQMYKGTAVSKWINKMTDGGIEKVNEKLFGKKGVESGLETIRNATYKALELGDTPFVRENFIERLGSYIKAQGIKSVDDVPDDAIQTAWEEAMKATYKDNSWAVKMLRGIKSGIEKAPVIGKPLSQSAIPFLQAPGNIAARMVDYSPVKALYGVGEIIKGKNNIDVVRKGIRDASTGLTGTGLILLGMALKGEDIITGDYSKDKDEKNFQKQNGFKPWALHVGDKYYTYDWAQPFAQNLMVGTLLGEAIENSDKDDTSILKALGYEGPKAAVNSWFSASPLQGLADLMKGSGYSGETDIAQNVINSLTDDFLGAMVPSLVNASAKTADTTQRNYYDPSDKVKTFMNQQIAKIPILSETLPAKYDTWGNRINYANSTGEAFAQRFLVPGDYGTEKSDRINDEINRLYTATNNNAVFPQTAPNKVGDTTLNNTQVSDYQRDMGKRSRLLVESLIKTDLYKSLDDESRAELLGQIYGASKLITERDLFKKPVSDNSSYKKLIKAFDEGGVNGMINYLSDTNQIKIFKKEAGAIRPDGSEKSLDKQELAVYLNSQGYSLDEINEWIEKGNFGKPYTQSEFNNVISKSRSWK